MLLRVVLGMESSRLRKRIENLMPNNGVLIQSVDRESKIWEQMHNESGDLFIFHEKILPDSPIQSVAFLKGLPEAPEVIVLVDRENPEKRAQFVSAGCAAVVFIGLADAMIRDVISAILETRRKSVEPVLDKAAPHAPQTVGAPRLSDFVSASPAMNIFMKVVKRVVQSDAPILILGETGVGKERLAKAIHMESARSKGPFIAVNCGALPEALLESELFGHEKGAFTGAIRARRGWFELAHNGTIFLDEIGDMPSHLQVKLLRALQEGEIQRIGTEKTLRVDVRIITATNKNLEKEMENERFRKDLFYRLSVVALTIPPLRERKEDIPALVESYIHFFKPRLKREVETINKRALDAIVQYPWPGNVRELMNVIERAMLLCPGKEIGVDELPDSISGVPRFIKAIAPKSGAGTSEGSIAVPADWLRKSLKEVRTEVVEEVERRYLQAILQETKGRIGETAKRAGIEPRSLYEKMRRFELAKESFKMPRIESLKK